MATIRRERPALLARFAAQDERLAGSRIPWLRELRARALGRFEDLGFPSTRLEDWKDTNVSRIAEIPFAPARPPGVGSVRLPEPGSSGRSPRRLVFVDGRHAPALGTADELPQGAWVGSLAEALEHRAELVEGRLGASAEFAERAFVALNTAFADDGALVVIPDGVEIEEPLEVLYLATAGAEPVLLVPRTLVVTGRGSRLCMLETFASLDGGAYLTDAVTELWVGENASLDHYRLQIEGPGGHHIGALHSRQARDSRFTSHNFDLGGSLTRLETTAVLDGEGAECVLDGLYLTAGRQHVDNHSCLDHARPHGRSRELYKGILAGDSRAVFNGRIVVRPGAQKTDAKQSNPNLLLSDGALVHTRPRLEIHADDVKCTHGATIGRLDRDAQFYLRSRGIPDAEARRMLIHAFASEILDRVGAEALRERLQAEVVGRLERVEGPP